MAYGWDTKFTVPFFFRTVTDFSAGALPISMKFCTTVQLHFAHFGGNSLRDGRILGINMKEWSMFGP